MNIDRKYVTLAGVFAGGVALGFGLCRGLLEKKVREDLALQIETIENAYNAAIALRDSRDMVKFVGGGSGSINVGPGDAVGGAGGGGRGASGVVTTVPDYLGEAINVTALAEEPVKNAYHQAMEATETPVEMFVDGGINDYGVSYIEEEEYLDEDGRVKSKIDILMDGDQPIFLMDGEPIDDWDARLGDSILVDFYKLCPPGIEPILYVRNHRTNEDYEVVRVEP